MNKIIILLWNSSYFLKVIWRNIFFFLKDNAFSDKHMYVHLSASSSGAAKYKHSNEPSVLNLLHKTVEKVCATVLLTRKANDFITTNL